MQPSLEHYLEPLQQNVNLVDEKLANFGSLAYTPLKQNWNNGIYLFNS